MVVAVVAAAVAADAVAAAAAEWYTGEVTGAYCWCHLDDCSQAASVADMTASHAMPVPEQLKWVVGQ